MTFVVSRYKSFTGARSLRLFFGRSRTGFKKVSVLLLFFWPCQDFERDYRVGHFGRQKRKEDVEGGDPLIKL